MSGPNPPGRESDDPVSGNEPSAELEPLSDTAGELDSVRESGEVVLRDQTGETDAYSRAYSAPESEQFVSGRYVPVDLSLYDYDSYDDSDEDAESAAPRWPWVVGIAAILAAISLVVSVSLLVTHTGSNKLAAPGTTPSVPPLQDEITTTKPPPPPSSAPPPHRHQRRPAQLRRRHPSRPQRRPVRDRSPIR
ncbi:putative transport accessory protein MmpS3 [Mycobacterium simulans]|uniref:Putative transport accessory protein MmpS3 n=1 Tax=Mycobacterium simulans TaxID=627089 RepID=A0A7Z7NBF8_9MYCO|nr:putative transport accessory protein MmpS3 [Mycobacterium simulans]